MTSNEVSRADLRRKLLDERNAMDANVRSAGAAAICRALAELLRSFCEPADPNIVIACYWPIRGEPDLRPLWGRWAHVALPIVTAPGEPLRFARWTAGEAMTTGRFGIAVPERPQWIEPSILIVPCLGFFVAPGARYFRLGYGGGYYDRTLAVRPTPTVGIAYSEARITEFALAGHDIPLDAIITQHQQYGALQP